MKQWCHGSDMMFLKIMSRTGAMNISTMVGVKHTQMTSHALNLTTEK